MGLAPLRRATRTGRFLQGHHMPHARLSRAVARLLFAVSLPAGFVCVVEAAGQSPAGKRATASMLITELIKAKEKPKADTATYDHAIEILVASDDLRVTVQLELVDAMVQALQADRNTRVAPRS
jgi:hypothetical protein